MKATRRGLLRWRREGRATKLREMVRIFQFKYLKLVASAAAAAVTAETVAGLSSVA